MSGIDEELEQMKLKVREMESEAARLREARSQVESPGDVADTRSVYVGNVDYGATPEELQAYFQSSGVINRVTILCDKFTGHPKGFAYIEFADPDSVTNSLALNESLFRGRLIKVTPKRTNLPGYLRGRGRGRSRGGRPRRGSYQ